jgi:hypothetical protein
MIALLWSRVQGTVAAILLVIGAMVSAWIVGRKTGGERVRAQAATREQELRETADAAARDAQRFTASERLRDGKF